MRTGPEKFYYTKNQVPKSKKKVLIENIALAEINGQQEMFIHHPGSAFNTLSSKFKSLGESKGREKWNEEIKFEKTRLVQAFTLDNLIQKYGVPDFIKIDAEGSELAIVKGLNQRVSFLSLEFVFPEFKEEFDEILKLLENKFSPGLSYNIAVNEVLLLSGFVNKDTLTTHISTTAYSCIELIVQMKIDGTNSSSAV